VSDRSPGITRKRRGRGFVYSYGGEPVTAEATLARIRRLAIPPAWRDVWICPRADGHIQAVGRDARGRKQYRYHARWREVRDAAKYERVAAFAAKLPAIRRRVARDLRRAGMPREKVLATIVRLLELTRVRIGNEEYTRANGSHGLTTLRNRHARVRGNTVRLSFRGKSGKQHLVEAHDPQVARVVERCQELPGQELFEWVDETGAAHKIESGDVNDYLREIAGSDFTAKDFRTWAGTLLAIQNLRALPRVNARATRKQVLEAVRRVADELGNTPAVCRSCYIHPAVFRAYEAGRSFDAIKSERAVIEFLRQTGATADLGEALRESRRALRGVNHRGAGAGRRSASRRAPRARSR
jgi:DNA topoisomerase-1